MDSHALLGKTAIITGSSRGIGREIALALAGLGANIVITGKTTAPHPKLEGTIYTVATEVSDLGAPVLALPLDVRDEAAIEKMVEQVVANFGAIDILVNNASAINISSTLNTPLKKFDLMIGVNVRATFACSQACIPYLKEAENPHILNLSPPFNMQARWFKDHVAYTISKYGMSMCTLGMAEELKAFNIAVNSLWPRTTIATAAIKNLFPPEIARASRSPEIVALAASFILQENSRTFTGNFLIDEEYLRSKGITDFDRFAVDSNVKLQRDFFLDE
ncbi:MAG: SDR family oxidoreductase [Candidatus Berkiellales bacterium]